MVRKGTKDRVPRGALRLRPQVVSNVGLYYVMPTSRNARGVDILAYDMRAQNYLGIQVKALSKRNPVPLGQSIDSASFIRELVDYRHQGRDK